MINSCIDGNYNQKKLQELQTMKRKRYLIENANNFKCYESLRLLVSQPMKYLVVHVIFICGMIYFYVLTFVVDLIVKQLNYVIIGAHVFTLVFFIILGFKNPGIVLKINEDFESRTQLNIPFNRDSKPAINQLPKTYSFPVKSHFISLRFCSECLIFKPPRAVHCWICNACISKMDHHCPFIGNCVGKGNYHYFIGFVMGMNTLLVMCIVQLVIMIVRIFQLYGSEAWTKPELYFAISLGVFCVAVFFFVGSLGAFHAYLIFNNLTTNEFFKKTWQIMSGNPFKKYLFAYERNFCVKNFLRFIKGPASQSIPHSHSHFEKSMLPRSKEKTEEYLSQVSNDYQYQHESKAQSQIKQPSKKSEIKSQLKASKVQSEKKDSDKKSVTQKELHLADSKTSQCLGAFKSNSVQI